MEQALKEAIVGPGDPEENAATMGRLGWLTALITDLKNNPAAMAALSEEDPGAHFEAMQEIDEMIRDVRAVLEGERRLQGRGVMSGSHFTHDSVVEQMDAATLRIVVLEEAAVAAEALDRSGREWVPDSLWANMKADTARAIRALASKEA
ncbi:MAG: hypothetical protein ACK4K7_06700 [Allosphingosinicella sp.]|uniref:hypothetical protein n=1 Tax=Allosphingosinicella sp. TaxID=2823234 RepID=UPI00395DA132